MDEVIRVVVKTYPQVAPYVALVPIVNLAATVLERATRRAHPTAINTALRWLSTFPGATKVER